MRPPPAPATVVPLFIVVISALSRTCLAFVIVARPSISPCATVAMGRRRGGGGLTLPGTSVDDNGGNADDESVGAAAAMATATMKTTTTKTMDSAVSIEEAAGELRRRASELRAEARASEMAIARGRGNAAPPLASSSAMSIRPVEYMKLGGSSWEMTCVSLVPSPHLFFSARVFTFVAPPRYFISTCLGPIQTNVVPS